MITIAPIGNPYFVRVRRSYLNHSTVPDGTEKVKGREDFQTTDEHLYHPHGFKEGGESGIIGHGAHVTEAGADVIDNLLFSRFARKLAPWNTFQSNDTTRSRLS